MGRNFSSKEEKIGVLISNFIFICDNDFECICREVISVLGA